MTWFRTLIRWLSGRPTKAEDGLVRDDVSAARKHAYAKMKEAEAREDDRDFGRWRMILQEATNDDLRRAVR